MASLVIHSEEPAQAATFTHRALIGRKAFNGVQLGQRIVSRIHAWIDKDEAGYYIRDARSRGGTYVNGERTDGKVILHDGDEIKVGISLITFHESDEIPEHAVTFHIAENGSNPEFEDPGILIACEECGAPMWVPASMAGAFGRCAICQAEINVPGEPTSGVRRPLTPNDSIVEMPAIREPVDLGDSARPHDPLAADLPMPKPAAAAKLCGVCQSPILAGDASTQCDNCSQTYHTECWHENRGCAAYGCPQVGCLDAPKEPAVTAAAAMSAASAPTSGTLPDPGLPAEFEPTAIARVLAPGPRPPPPEPAVVAAIQEEALASEVENELPPAPSKRKFPWDFALLGGSVLGTIVGLLTFGLPALLIGAASAIYAMRQRDGRRVATVAALICLVGVAGGYVASCLYFNVPFNNPIGRSR